MTRRFVFLNLYPRFSIARYQLSAYVLKAYVERKCRTGSWRISVVNLPAQADEELILNALEEARPDAIGYSCYTWNIEKILSLMPTIRSRLEAAHVFGGPEVTLERIESFSSRHETDYYVIGEGEEALCQLLRAWEKSFPRVDSLPAGVTTGSSKPPRKFIPRSESLALGKSASVYLSGAMDRSLYDRRQAFLETQRGCRFRCKYCTYHKNLPRVKYYPLQRVLDELDHLICEANVQAIRIFDAIFTSDLERSKRIVRHLVELKSRGVHIPMIYWELTSQSVDEEFCQLVGQLKTRSDICNSKDLTALDRPQMYGEFVRGYTVINCLGIQSFHLPSLKAVGRFPVTRNEFAGLMGLMKRHNLNLKIDMILGLPHEDLQTFMEALSFMLPHFRDTDHVLNIHRLQILPGTELVDVAAKTGLAFDAPPAQLVTATDCMRPEDLLLASRLCAVLFRTVNSPLRERFLNTLAQAPWDLAELLRLILSRIETSSQTSGSQLATGQTVDDTYWNELVFKEIPSQWLQQTLTQIAET
jgi:radical SAM superfamily enzyme YgiQ (UPF0313 family)